MTAPKIVKRERGKVTLSDGRRIERGKLGRRWYPDLFGHTPTKERWYPTLRAALAACGVAEPGKEVGR